VAKVLLIAAIAWPMFLAAGLRSRIEGDAPWLTAAVYLSAGRVCHQRPERSFHTSGVSWPVCGRCAGLYLAAPFGAAFALMSRRRRHHAAASWRWMALAAAPTALTWALEFASVAPMTSLVRALAALPLGAAVAFAIVTAVKPASAIE
jgi:uncharacterized membrane protein